jgi:hypothetical protein
MLYCVYVHESVHATPKNEENTNVRKVFFLLFYFGDVIIFVFVGIQNEILSTFCNFSNSLFSYPLQYNPSTLYFLFLTFSFDMQDFRIP